MLVLQLACHPNQGLEVFVLFGDVLLLCKDQLLVGVLLELVPLLLRDVCRIVARLLSCVLLVFQATYRVFDRLGAPLYQFDHWL